MANNAGLDTSGEASSDFFSPPPAVGGSILPRNHDSSWIGARQSPIQSFDDDLKGTPNGGDSDDDDDNDATEKYHRALHESLKKLDHFNYGRQPDETAHLLESGKIRHPEYASFKQGPQHMGKAGSIKQGPSSIHPLWNGASSEERRRNAQKYSKYYTKQRSETRGDFKWGHALLAISGCYVLGTALFEFVSWYQERDGDIGIAHWNWNTIVQPRNVKTLVRFGGMDVGRIIYHNEYWRLLSSQFICGSFLEWFLMTLSWLVAIYNNSTFRPKMLSWAGTFSAAAFVGQLWVIAWDRDAQTATAATWGTCGVLTCFGIDRPNQRDLCFLTATGFVLLAWWELPCNSVFGATGASFFGWLLSAASSPDRLFANHTPRPSSHIRFIVLLAFVLMPALYIGFRPRL
ncbi:hypothetical protein ACA910_008596 [Epithemia clementina (nom. ined.)]